MRQHTAARRGGSSRATAAPCQGGDLTLYVDGSKVGEGRIDATQPMIFSADETTDVGNDSATAVSDDYGPENSLPGKIHWIQLDAGTEDLTTSSAQRNASASLWPANNG